MTVIRIGTRGSALALWQTRHIAAQLGRLVADARIDIVEIVSTGDRITDVPLTEVEGTGFFTATLERALLDNRVDIAVHSYKDLPVDASDQLLVAAVPARGPVEDVLCARNGLTLRGLPSGARVGTCSARRTAQVSAMRGDLDIQPLRGNVPTRVERVARGELDAVVLARAGLVRLGLDQHITETFGLDVMMPAPAQGALAVQCRADATDLSRQLSALDDLATRRAVTAERTVLHALGGGCSVPVGAAATCEDDQVVLSAGVFALDGSRALRLEERGSDPIALGERMARHLLEMGADEILASFDKAARLERPASSGASR